MAYTTQLSLAHETTFQGKVLVAMASTAKNVQAEDSGTANHANRSGYARSVLNNPNLYLFPFCLAVVTNAAINSASLDSDIQFTVDSLWNAMAGTQ